MLFHGCSFFFSICHIISSDFVFVAADVWLSSEEVTLACMAVTLDLLDMRVWQFVVIVITKLKTSCHYRNGIKIELGPVLAESQIIRIGT
jgi:hypothetical protein